MTPLVTVVTPSYNNRSTIKGAIASVLSQSYPAIQYILADDASLDFDEEELKAFISSEKRENVVEFLILRNEQNLGVAQNLNFALSHAKGKYVFNVAADDEFYDSDVISEWVEQFEKTGAQVITAKRAIYDCDMANELSVAPSPEEIDTLTRSTPQELFEKMCGYNMIFGCCTARTLQSFELMGGYDTRYPLIEDYPSNMKLLRAGVKILFWDRKVVKYRSGGISSQGGLSDEYLAMSDEIFTKEILPFSQSPSQAKKAYSDWRKEAEWQRSSRRYKQKHNVNNIAQRALYLAYMTIKHPIIAIKRITKRANNGH